jgi:hypothetical protein
LRRTASAKRNAEGEPAHRHFAKNKKSRRYEAPAFH